jgi:diacylglycerol kinase family enzyme
VAGEAVARGRLGQQACAMSRMAAFVVNPTRVRDWPRVNARCQAAALASGWDPVLLETAVDDAGTTLTERAVAAGAGLVFAMGGDGTVRACAQALAGTPVPLAIVPRGTANLTARALGVPAGLDAALRVGFGPHERRIDLAVADGTTYAAMAGIGVDAAVVGATPGGLKAWAGWLAYAAAGARHALGPHTAFELRLDGAAPLRRRARSVVVGNAGLLPGGFALLPGARLDDGVLDVGILAPSSPLGWARVGYRVIARSRHEDRRLERHQARRIEISAAGELPREVDGEMIGPGRSLTVTVMPAALLVRVPGGRAGLPDAR